MLLQFSTPVRAARADVTESTIGASPTLDLRSGAAPASCADADAGTLLASATLPADWLTNPGTGVKALLGTWQDAAADAAGTLGHFRIKQGATCHIQGDITITAGGGAMTVDNITTTVGLSVTVTAFTLTEGQL